VFIEQIVYLLKKLLFIEQLAVYVLSKLVFIEQFAVDLLSKWL
jgi:hypothetical protein